MSEMYCPNCGQSSTPPIPETAESYRCGSCDKVTYYELWDHPERGPNTIYDVIPDPQDADWVSIIECTECGYTGHMYSTDKPHPDRQWWNCKDCESERPVKHEIIVSTNRGEDVDE